MRRLIKDALKTLKCNKIQEAEDGAEGLKALQVFQPDLIIVDFDMPVLDGIDFTRLVRRNFSEKDIPIIMLTGNAEGKHVATARDAGVTEYLVKPVSASTLQNRMLAAISTPREFVDVGSYAGPDRRRRHEDVFEEQDRRSG